MAEEWRPGVIPRKLALVTAEGNRRSDEALLVTAISVENEVKVALLRSGTHVAGTPTPASPGNPPALVSGQLRRSISHTVLKGLAVTTVRIGPAETTRLPYSKKGSRSLTHRVGGAGGTITNGKLGLILETGVRGGHRYPFMKEGFDKGIAGREGQWRVVFSRPWVV